MKPQNYHGKRNEHSQSRNKIITTKKAFAIDDTVSIIRHRHGWPDGSIKGVVSTVAFRSGGAAYYTVTDADGQDYQIYNTKDLKAN